MKPSTLKFLVCPACQAEPTLKAHVMKDSEVIRGEQTPGFVRSKRPGASG